METGGIRACGAAMLVAAGVIISPALCLAQRTELPGVDRGIARFVPASPSPASFIADVPNVIPPAEQQSLDERIAAVQAAGLGDIGVAVIPSIGDYLPYEVGLGIYRTWRIGRIDSLGTATRDLGVLLLIVPKELSPNNKGHCWITTGLGAEGIITDGVAGEICDRVVPFLAGRNYPAAVGAGIDAIAERMRAALTSTAQPAPAPSSSVRSGARGVISPTSFVGPGIGVAGLAVLGGGIILALRWRRRRPRPCPRCGSMMTLYDEAQDDSALDRGQLLEERLKSVDYDVWGCQCGERLVLPHRRWFSGYSKCPSCGVRALKSTRTVLVQPTQLSTGLAEMRYHCEACGQRRTEQQVLPKVPPPNTTRSSHGGGGGGRSFGGSGRTGGGGGGRSY